MNRVQSRWEPTAASWSRWADPLGISDALSSVSCKQGFQSTLGCQGLLTGRLLKLVIGAETRSPDALRRFCFRVIPDRSSQRARAVQDALTSIVTNAILGGFGLRVAKKLHSERLAEMAQPAAEFLDRIVSLASLDHAETSENQDLCDLINVEILSRTRQLATEVTPRLLGQSCFMHLIAEEMETRRFEALLLQIPLLDQLTDITAFKSAWDALSRRIEVLPVQKMVPLLLFLPVLQETFQREFESALRTAGLHRLAEKVSRGERVEPVALCRPAYSVNPALCRASIGLQRSGVVLSIREVQTAALQVIRSLFSELSSDVAVRAWIEEMLSRVSLGTMCAFGWTDPGD